ncbi:hypothetical protein BU24DRAFT_414661 [Aaosphaeria arxii CBS 175.79]|uniref:Uncharacterized protein n=1 Tax=Aaosphaeria arxii CBS 175.79 TaxID=1450172 RepID=A0A6A5XBG5_9PLEO|nr:uncharacterized protein BU24DRAFT_414661 [Aaosphaeria arxii CBS 175.79]KAF2010239.1 hypothetical protein BU24DRAFT_414661 [Aaosphaeria arxii CBS 175.79]
MNQKVNRLGYGYLEGCLAAGTTEGTTDRYDTEVEAEGKWRGNLMLYSYNRREERDKWGRKRNHSRRDKTRRRDKKTMGSDVIGPVSALILSIWLAVGLIDRSVDWSIIFGLGLAGLDGWLDRFSFFWLFLFVRNFEVPNVSSIINSNDDDDDTVSAIIMYYSWTTIDSVRHQQGKRHDGHGLGTGLGLPLVIHISPWWMMMMPAMIPRNQTITTITITITKNVIVYQAMYDLMSINLSMPSC